MEIRAVAVEPSGCVTVSATAKRPAPKVWLAVAPSVAAPSPKFQWYAAAAQEAVKETANGAGPLAALTWAHPACSRADAPGAARATGSASRRASRRTGRAFCLLRRMSSMACVEEPDGEEQDEADVERV